MAEAIKFRVSTIPAVLERLRDILTEASYPQGPDPSVIAPFVCIGHPGNEATREDIVIGDVVSLENFAAIGARSRDEKYDVNLDVIAAFPGQSQSEANARVFDLWGAVCRELRMSPTLGFGVSASQGQVISVQVGSVDLFEVFRDEGAPQC